MKSHQTQKKCGKKKTRSVSPSNPFLKYFKKREKPSNYPPVIEPKPEIISHVQASEKKRVVLLKFTKEDLQITGEIVPADADRRSAEYRTKIRQHYDSLKEQFPTLTCADYARANEPRLHERTFQGWCTKEYRTEDRNKIKARIKAKPEIKDEIDRRGYKDSFN